MVSCCRWAVSPRRHLCMCPRHLFVVIMCRILVMSSFHVGAALSSSSQVLLSPHRFHPHMSSSRVILACHPHVSWSCRSCAVASSSCVFLASATIVLVLAASLLSHVVVLCVSKVGWDEWGGGGYSPGCLVVACVHSWVLAIVCVCFQVFFVIWGCAGGRCSS